jgi:hypothetical protein
MNTPTTRAQVLTAFEALVQGAYPWQTFGTRLKQISDVSPAQRPACFVVHAGAQRYKWTNDTIPLRTLNVLLYVYTTAPDQETSDAPIQNAIMDALDLALTQEFITGRITLTSLVYNTRIKGPVLQVPGDLDGDGMLFIPVEITLP